MIVPAKKRLFQQALSIGAFILITTGIMFYILKKSMGIRVSRDEELDGLDKHEHAMLAYVM